MTALNIVDLHPAPAPPREETLVVRGVSKNYIIDRKPLKVLQDIDLGFAPGEFVSIVGRSGCGKSTLLRLIAGLEGGYSGQIKLDGEAIRAPSLDRGLIFQDPSLLPWMTVRENVAFALINHDLTRQEKAARVAEHIDLVGLNGFEQAYPKELSGGMAQRAAIARALVSKPKVLLLDEPLGALDALTRVHLQGELQRIWLQQKTTMIMVTHDVEEAVYLGDRVVVMDARPGRIRRIVDVPLAHPRDRTSPALHAVRDAVLADLMDGGAR